MNSKNISVRTLLPLCLVIAIAFMAMPAYAQPVCDGCDKIVFEDNQFIEVEAKCDGTEEWIVLPIPINIGDPGELALLLIVYNEGSVIFDGSLTFAEGLAKRELKLESLGSAVLEIEFKFKEQQTP